MATENINTGELFFRIRQIPLPERLERCGEMVAAMCGYGPPLSTQSDDVFLFLDTTLRDVKHELQALTELLELRAPDALKRLRETQARLHERLRALE